MHSTFEFKFSKQSTELLYKSKTTLVYCQFMMINTKFKFLKQNLNYSFINTKQIEFEGYIFLGEWHIENKLARFLNMICFIDSSVEACCYTSGWLNDSDNK